MKKISLILLLFLAACSKSHFVCNAVSGKVLQVENNYFPRKIIVEFEDGKRESYSNDVLLQGDIYKGEKCDWVKE